MPAVAVGELSFGAAKSGRPSENTAGRSVVPCDLRCRSRYGRLKKRLGGKGGHFPRTTPGLPLLRNVTAWSLSLAIATSRKLKIWTRSNGAVDDRNCR